MAMDMSGMQGGRRRKEEPPKMQGFHLIENEEKNDAAPPPPPPPRRNTSMNFVEQTDGTKLEKPGETIYRERGTGEIYDPKVKAAEKAAARQVTGVKKDMKIGLVQIEDEQRQRDEVVKSLSEKFEADPFNEEADEKLRNLPHWDDPMKNWRKKEKQELSLRNAPYEVRRKRIKDRIEAEVRARLSYQGRAPVNRFRIKPGFKWDGVDRGNGWEDEILRARAERAGGTHAKEI